MGKYSCIPLLFEVRNQAELSHIASTILCLNRGRIFNLHRANVAVPLSGNRFVNAAIFVAEKSTFPFPLNYIRVDASFVVHHDVVSWRLYALTLVLEPMEEVVPIPFGDSMVQYCTREQIICLPSSHSEDPSVNPLLHDDESKAGLVIVRNVTESIPELFRVVLC